MQKCFGSINLFLCIGLLLLLQIFFILMLQYLSFRTNTKIKLFIYLTLRNMFFYKTFFSISQKNPNLSNVTCKCCPNTTVIKELSPKLEFFLFKDVTRLQICLSTPVFNTQHIFRLVSKCIKAHNLTLYDCCPNSVEVNTILLLL